jgi:hypothetical protein
MQELWSAKIAWDEKLPDDLKSKWLQCRKSIKQIGLVEIPRQLQQSVFDEGSKVQLHVFCDASKSAYAATLYVRVENQGKITSDLLLSKSRVSPIRNPLAVPK